MQRIAMRDLDPSCGGLLPLIAPLEAAPAIRDDRGNVWLTREEVRVASLRLAETIASEQKQLVFLFCGANSETVIGLLAAAAAGHATALIDPSLTGDRLKGLVEAYQPELILGSRAFGEKLRAVADAAANTRSLTSEAGVIEWIARDAEPPSVPINPALELLLSTSGTTGSQKYVRLSRDAIVANARRSPKRWPSTNGASALLISLCTIPMGSPSSPRIWRRGAEFVSSTTRSPRRASGPRSGRSAGRISRASPFTTPRSRVWAQASSRNRSRCSPKPAERSILAFRRRFTNGRRCAAAGFSSCMVRPRPRRA